MKISGLQMVSLRGKLPVLGIMLAFGFVFSSISLVNHYNFRTAALDLGMFNHALYSFAHFKMNFFTLGLTSEEINYFGDHFSPISFFYVPLYYIFGTYALLVLQIAVILFGGVGIYRYASLKFISGKLPLLFLVQFFGIWGIYSALAFDFHNNVVGAMLVPWLFYFYEVGKRKWFLAIFLLILFSKENMALWLGFILIALAMKNRKAPLKELLKFEISLALVAWMYFFIAMGIIMPGLSQSVERNFIYRYGFLGDSMVELFLNALKYPKYFFSLLFESSLPDAQFNGIKSELHFMVLVSGGLALIYKPIYLFMLVPIYLQKLLCNDFGFWGINNHYSIEFAPILSLGLIDFFGWFKSKRPVFLFIGTTIFLTFFFNFKTIESRKSLWYDKSKTAFYAKEHYQTLLNIPEIHRLLKTIPDDAILSVSSNIAPHLAFRDRIYMFPVVRDADMIVLLNSTREFYPLSQDAFQAEIRRISEGGHYQLLVHEFDLMIFRRKGN